MALPVTITGINVTVACVGPFKSSGGNYYFFGRDGSLGTTLRAYKATAPDTSWASIASKTGFTSTGVQFISGCQVGNIIHLIITDGTTTSSNHKYQTFDMSSDTFVTAETINSALNTQTSGSVSQYNTSVVVRSGGEVVILYNAARISTFSQIAYRRRTAVNTWAAGVAVSTTGVNCTNPIAVLGASDRLHFIWHDSTNVKQRHLTSANVLGTEASAGATAVPLDVITRDAGGGTIKFVGLTSASAFRWTSADNPTVTNAAITFGTPIRGADDSGIFYAMYQNAGDSDLYAKQSTDDGASFSSALNVFTGTVAAADVNLSKNQYIYQRGLSFVFPYIVNDNGTLKYNEAVVRTDTGNRYWRGGTATWDATAGSKWADTVGGAAGASVPDANQNVYFDATSGAVVVTLGISAVTVNALNFTGFTGTFASTSGANVISVGGDLTLSSSMTIGTPFASFAFSGTNSKTITSAGKTIPTGILFNAAAAYTLADDFNSTNQVTVSAGTFNANGKNVTAVNYIFSSTPTINMGAGVWTATGSGTPWSMAAGVTLNCNTSTIRFTGTTASSKTFAGAGKVYNNLDNATTSGTFVVTGSNTFNIFDIAATGAANGRSVTITAGTTTTVNELKQSVGTGHTLSSVTAASHTLVDANGGTNTLAQTTVSWSSASGATFQYGTDGGNNTGWSASGTSYTDTITSAAMPIGGAAIAPVYGRSDTLTASSVPIGGAALADVLGYGETVAASALPVSGAAIALVYTARYSDTLAASALPINGATITPIFSAGGIGYTDTISPSALPLVGQTVAPVYTANYADTITPSTMPIGGTAVAPVYTARYADSITPSSVPIGGATITPVYYTAGGGGPWAPTSIAGLNVWLDASALGLADEAVIAAWPNDGSGSDPTIVGGGVGAGPYQKTNFLNGLPVARFHAGYGRVRGTFGITYDHTLIYLVRSWGTIGRSFSATYPPVNFLVGWHTSGTDLMYDNGWVYAGTVVGNGDSAWAMYESDGIGPSGTNVSRFFKNATLLGTNTAGLGQGLNGTWGLSGFSATGTEETMDCYIAEVLIYDSKLSDADRQAAEGYLSHKWGLQANLPSDHPYKSAPPAGSGGVVTTETITASALPITGQTVAPVYSANYSDTITPSSVPINGVAVAPVYTARYTETLTASAVPIVGASVAPVYTANYADTITQSSVPIGGQIISPVYTARYADTLTASSVPLVGAAVAPIYTVNYADTLTASTIPIGGATLADVFARSDTITVSAVPIVGAALADTFARSDTLTASTVPLIGQIVSPVYTVSYIDTITASTVPLVGQSITPIFSAGSIGYSDTITPSVVPIVGAALADVLAITETLAASSLPVIGQALADAYGRTDTLAAGSVPLVGAALADVRAYGETVTASALPVVGSTVAPVYTANYADTLTASAVPLVGQSITPIFSAGSIGYSDTILASALPLIGATLAPTARYSESITVGIVPIIGQAIAPVYTANYSDAITASALPLVGQAVTPIFSAGSIGYSDTITPSTVPIGGAAVAPVYTARYADSIAASVVPINGTALADTFARSDAIAAGLLPISGVAVVDTYGRIEALTASGLPIGGQVIAPTVRLSDTLTASAVPLVGQAITPVYGHIDTIVASAVPLVGAALTPVYTARYSDTITASSVPLVGQYISPVISITAGVLLITGQIITPIFLMVSARGIDVFLDGEVDTTEEIAGNILVAASLDGSLDPAEALKGNVNVSAGLLGNVTGNINLEGTR